MNNFYAYIHARPSTQDVAGIFYVGKGTARRAYAMKSANRNQKHLNIQNKYGSENILVGVIPCSSEEIAFDLEVGLIKCLRRSGVDLANMSDGGEGASGASWSEEQRANLSASRKGRIITQEWRNNISASMAGVGRTSEHRKNLSAALKGRKPSEQCKAAALIKLKQGGAHTPEANAKRSAALKGKKRPAEVLAKIHATRWGKQSADRDYAGTDTEQSR